VYRDALFQNVRSGQWSLVVLQEDVEAFSSELGEGLVSRPSEFMGWLEAAAREVAETGASAGKARPVHVTLRSERNPVAMRSLGSQSIAKLVKVPGIVIAASKVRAKATTITATCRQCRNTIKLNLAGGLAGVSLPRVCPGQQGGDPNNPKAKCPVDPYVIVGDKSLFVDQQTCKVQERPEAVPTGEMPRSLLAVLDRTLVGKVVPGMRVDLIGVWSIFQRQGSRGSGATTRETYLRVLGMHIDNEGAGRSKETFTPEEEAQMIEMAGEDGFYDRFSRSIAPSIYGHSDIKKAIALLLVGGARKILPDGMRLRGDINVLLLGDPGTAKSQLLKFTEKVAPIAVYTSGKGSSAAGLTASVVRDPNSREFYLEGGAMVLADGGVVCIDEFDKMREEDRVAIHEAMEQQTISIAKAGITTILNSRTSVLAAANPVFGRYDDMRSPTDNIDFQATILSRFDLIFIVRDVRDSARDKDIARHVLGLHMRSGGAAPDARAEDAELLTVAEMKKFVAFARSRPPPRLSESAAESLRNSYVNFRKDARNAKYASAKEGSTPIPITVRQLEAIIRVTEARAKIQLAPHAGDEHVTEAVRLFHTATLEAAKAGIVGALEGFVTEEAQNEIKAAEAIINRKIAVRASVRTEKFVEEVKLSKVADHSVRVAIQRMIQEGVLEFRNERKTLYRVK
jgi:DNA replication licensing factor MCM5